MIRDCRVKAGLTQAELAIRIGVDRTSVVKWETGSASPRAGKLLEIADAVGCTVDELLSPAQEQITDANHSSA